jgi:hypothetical protein
MFSNSFVKQMTACLKPAFFGLVLFVSSLNAYEYVAITEILKNPVGPSNGIPGDASHECLELTNLGTDTFSIDSLFLFDNPGGIDSIVPWDTLKNGVLSPHQNCRFNSPVLAPGARAVILDPDYFKALQVQPSSRFTIDSGTTILTVNRIGIGNDGLASNDGIVLYKGTHYKISRIITFAADDCRDFTLSDTVRQTKPQPAEGVSIIPTSLLFCPPSFVSCPTGLSLGHYECIKNGWLAEWKFVNFNSGSSTSCSLACLKVGSLPSSQASWSVKRIVSNNESVLKQGAFETNSLITRLSVSLPLDSTVYSFQVSVSEGGRTIDWTIDLSGLWTPPFPLKINELFPRAQTDVPEWFEIVNSSSMPININNWRYGNSESSFPITQEDLVVGPGQFLVVTKDKTLFSRQFPAVSCVCQPDAWLALDNYKDTLCLWNNRGTLCETVAYNYAWFDNWTDQSLERVSVVRDGISSNSWVVAPKPSPGQPNLSAFLRSTQSPSLEIGPVPFTPNNDGNNDFLSIQCVLPASYSATMALYGFNGRKYCDVPISLQPQYLWDGKTSTGTAAPVGPFFVVATIKNGAQTIVLRKKGILWR